MRNFGKPVSTDGTDSGVEKNDYPRASDGVVSAAIVTCVGYATLVMSVFSPYWLQSYESTMSPFLNMGLWQYCFREFVYPKYQIPKSFTGCHSVFSHEFYVIREYLLPGWLLGVQVFVVLAFLLALSALALLALTIMRLPLKGVLQYEWLLVRLAYFGMLISMICIFAGTCIFTACAYKRDWMMYPEFNIYGWSYALAWLTCLLFGWSTMLLYREARLAYDLRDEQRNLVMQMEMQEPGYHHGVRHHHHHHQHSHSRSLQGYI